MPRDVVSRGGDPSGVVCLESKDMLATRLRLTVMVMVFASLVGQALAGDIGTAFTYQGVLEKPAGTPLNDTCDLRFRLYDAAAGGNLIGTNPWDALGVAITDGAFVTDIDFGASAFTGDARWLDIQVKCTGDAVFVPL